MLYGRTSNGPRTVNSSGLSTNPSFSKYRIHVQLLCQKLIALVNLFLSHPVPGIRFIRKASGYLSRSSFYKEYKE